MATFTTTPENAVAIAQRLLKANVPFDLHVGESGTIYCRFEETLNLAVYQQELASLRAGGIVTRKITDPYRTPTGRISNPQPEFQRFPRRISETEQKFFIDLPSGTEQVTPGGLMPNEGVEYLGRHHKPRNPASIGTDASCPMTDTEFDSDPSVVGE